MTRKIITCLVLLFNIATFRLAAQDSQVHWVDSVYNSLTPAERVAQLMLIRAWSLKDSTYNDSLAGIVARYNPGGLCFFKGTPVRQALLCNRLQTAARTPLLISTDAEWGLGMRLDSAFSFPRQMALGAIRDDSLIYRMGRVVGRQCSRLGVHINFAPVADVNNNPENPVIGFRSFGENRELVAKKCILYMKGMQDEGIITTAKHFPGHGDTGFDSHYTLPVIDHDRRRLDSVELYPFRHLISAGVKGIMTGHLFVPALDSSLNTATTLSKPVITGLLKSEMGFRGFAVTDALDMQGVTKYFPPGEIEVKALEAGNDILLLPQDMDKAVNGILTAIDSGRIEASAVETACRRILTLKYQCGLAKNRLVDATDLESGMNPPEAAVITARMVGESLTLLGNNLQMVPLTALDKRKIAIVEIGDTLPNRFQEVLGKYLELPVYRLPRGLNDSIVKSTCRELSQYDLIVAGVHGITSNTGDNFGLNSHSIRLIDTLVRINRTILTWFGTPYALNKLSFTQQAEAILVAYQDNEYTQETSAMAIFGGIPIRGRLPVTAGGFASGSGETAEKSRLAFDSFNLAGIPQNGWSVVDSLVNSGLEAGAYPGCQVLFAKDGRVIYEKSWGHPMYNDSVEVTGNSIYDLASVTKIAATTLAVMKLYDQGLLRLTDPLGKHLPMARGTDKASLTIGSIMAHEAGLQDWIPFFKETLRNGQPDPALYGSERSDQFPVQVCDSLFMSPTGRNMILKQILESPVAPDKKYRYSDLGFYMLREMVEEMTGKTFESYLNETFYRPLGLSTMTFNPLDRFPRERIMPTEFDREFRHRLIRGYVHDPGAAMLGGVSGHAGLFSNSRDLAVILQLILNKGTYGGKEYFTPSTFEAFTKPWDQAGGNRRGVGFDMPPAKPDPNGPVCAGVSQSSFGHSGFTGTYCWADPSSGLIYVFLSNRVCPDAANNKLSRMNIRTDIHQAAIELLLHTRTK